MWNNDWLKSKRNLRTERGNKMTEIPMLRVESIPETTCKKRDRKGRRMRMGIGLAFAMLVLGPLSAGAQPLLCPQLPPPRELPPAGNFTTPDGDNIKFSLKDGEEGHITVCLSSAQKVTWWKGIKVFGNASWSALALLAIQDEDHGPSCRTIPTGRFEEDASRLEFWKAKRFGVHCHIVSYTFKPSDFHGKSLDFLWETD